MLLQFMEGDKETDGIMPFGTCKAQKERYIGFELGIITGELEERIAKVIFVQIAVPSPGSVGVRKMPQGIRGAVPVVSARAGMGMYGSAVARNSKVFLWDQAACNRRQDGGVVKKELETLFKVKRDVPAIQQACGNGFRDFRF